MFRVLPLLLLCVFSPVSLQAQENAVEQQIERIRHIVLSRKDSPAAIAQLVQLTRDLPASAAATLYAEIADDYLRAGQYDQAGELLRQVVEQYPDQPTTIPALTTLARLYASSEVVSSQATGPPQNSTGDDLATYALHLVANTPHEQLAAAPPLSFQCAVAARRSGRLSAAQSFLTPLKHSPRTQPWHARARAETWLTTQRDSPPPVTTRACLPVTVRPVLDGQLQDATWQSTTAHTLPGGLVSYYARDEEFFYWALRVPQQPGLEYPPDERPRHYDTELAPYDHVQLQLDLDRDYATSFCLAVNYRGQTHDSCWKSPHWNPQWFVASAQDDAHWSVEAAIPWTALGGTPPLPSDAWVLALQHRLPDHKIPPPPYELLLFQ